MLGGGIDTHSNIPQELLSLVYAAASDRSKWQMFCDELNKVSNTPIMLFGHNLGTNESLGIIASGLDPGELDRYHQHYADKNPWMHMNAAMPMGAVGISDQALRREDLYRTEFYNDWLRLQEDIVAGPCLMCHRTTETFVGLAAACPAANVDNTLGDSLKLFEALAPHMAQAITMSQVLANGGPMSYGHLEASKHAIITLCRSGRVSMSNPLAEKFMTQTQMMSVNLNERLTAKGEAVRDYLSIAHRAMARNDFSALPAPHHVVTPAYGEYILHAHIFPFSADHDFPASVWLDPVVGAIVITGELGLEHQENYCQLAQALGATPAESQLAEAIMAGQSLYDYAEANALSRHTVRNQMRALLHKTGTDNQMAFVRRMHTLSSPFTLPQS